MARYRATGHGRYIDARTVLELPAVHKTGEEIVVEMTLSPIEGGPAGERLVLAIIRDVTERRRIAEALRASEERLARVLETNADGVLITDVAGRITFANAAAEAVYGLPRSRIIGRRYNDPAWPITALDGTPFTDGELAFERVVRTGASVHGIEYAVQRPNDSRVALSVNAAPLHDADGSLTGVVISVRDITERRHAEERRIRLIEEQAARVAAEAAVRERDKFLTVAAHELKTPVTGLRLAAQLLLRQMRAGSAAAPDQFGRALETIDQQAEKLSRLVGQLLDIARIEAGQLTIERTRTDLVALVRDAVASVQAQTNQRRVRVQAPAQVWASVDPLRLEQVLVNLIDNALKYSPAESSVEIDVATPGPDVTRVSVTDRGIGIRPEDRARVFERFFRAGPSDSVSVFGVGLSISRQSVARSWSSMAGASTWRTRRAGGRLSSSPCRCRRVLSGADRVELRPQRDWLSIGRAAR